MTTFHAQFPGRQPGAHHRQWRRGIAPWIAAGVFSFAAPTQALVNGTATSSFRHLGTTPIASGVLIAPSWVLTAAHAASGSGTFSSGYGSAAINAAYSQSSGMSLDNDIALLHLASALGAPDWPILNDLTVMLGIDVTLASPRNGSPRAYGDATLTNAYDTYDDPGTPGGPVTVNWLETSGPVYVQSGDSGSGLFKGQVTDSGSAILLGLASAVGDCGSGSGICSFYVQTAPYRSWIDATLAPSGQHARWASEVPEPQSAALLLAGLGLLAAFGGSGRNGRRLHRMVVRAFSWH